MAYHPNDNPLKNVRVERITSCEDRNHIVNLLIWGGCTKCRQVLPVPGETVRVFERLNQMKKLSV